MRPKLHILLLSFVYSPNLGGVETHLDDLVSYLTQRHYYVSVITYQPLLSNKNAPIIEKRKNAEIHRLPWFKFNLFHKLEKIPVLEVLYLVPVIALYSIYFILRYRKKVDVIQTHGFNMAIVGALLAALFRIPFTVNTHVCFAFQKTSVYARLLRTVLNASRNILVLTSSAKKELVKIGVRPPKISVYHYWVDQVFRPLDQRSSRRQLGWREHDRVVLFVGRLIKAKGIDILLRASGKFGKNTRLVIIGSGPLSQVVHEYASKNRAIQYVGEKSTKELPLYYAAADICIIPSAPPHGAYTEGIPRVMIESFSCGTPVIATHMGGLKDYVSPSVGRIVAATASSIARAIHDVTSDTSLLSHMRMSCVALSRSAFSRAVNAEIIEDSLV